MRNACYALEVPSGSPLAVAELLIPLGDFEHVVGDITPQVARAVTSVGMRCGACADAPTSAVVHRTREQDVLVLELGLLTLAPTATMNRCWNAELRSQELLTATEPIEDSRPRKT